MKVLGRKRICNRICWRSVFSLRTELLLALILKAILLTILWKVSFHDPLDKHLSKADMVEHIVGTQY